MTTIATADPTNIPPRVLLQVADIPGAAVTVTRTDPDGISRPVRSAEAAALTGGAWQGYDYEMPFGAAVTYTATAADGTTDTPSSPVTVDSTVLWLTHPGLPYLSVSVDPTLVSQMDDRSRSARSAVLEPLGRATPLVVTDVRRTAQAGLTVFTETLPDRDRMWSLLESGTPVLLNIPPSLGWGVTYEWAAIGDVTEAYFARGAQARLFTMPYTVVDRPVGALQAQWTYAGVLAGYTNYSAIRTAYPTYSDMLANSPTTP